MGKRRLPPDRCPRRRRRVVMAIIVAAGVGTRLGSSHAVPGVAVRGTT